MKPYHIKALIGVQKRLSAKCENLVFGTECVIVSIGKESSRNDFEKICD